MRILVLVKGGKRQSHAHADMAREQFESMDVKVVHARAERLTDWPTLIDSYANRIDCVVVGGGDGSLSFVIESIMRNGLTLGVLPLGTANDFARTLGYPNDLSDACRTVAKGVDHCVDVGQVNDVYFLNVASIGLAVRAHHYRSDRAKRWFGALGYVKNVYSAFRHTRPFRAWITCDGAHRELRSIQLAIGNGRYFGGGLAVSEDATLDDSRLDLFSLEPQSAGRLMRLLPALIRGPDPTTRGTQLMQGARIHIDTTRPRSINTDGEVLTHTPATFRVLPQALTVRVPKAFRDEFFARNNNIRETL